MRAAIDAHPVVTGGVQQLAVGLSYFPIAFLTPYHHPIVWHTRAALAVVYLAIFGGIVGYSSYKYALENLPLWLFTARFIRMSIAESRWRWMVILPRAFWLAGGCGNDYNT